MRLLPPLFLFSASAVLLFAQKPPEATDGQWHGDAPYLLEDGWKPLLDGQDLKGWHGRDTHLPFEWFTTRGVRWEPVLSPARLSGVAAPAGAMLNGPAGKTVDLVTDGKFGDVELYLEFLIPKGSNSGVYLHSLYEVQIYDSWGVEHPQYIDCGGIYHRWINNQGVGGSGPKTNASRRPGEWQSFYIWFRAPRFDAAGKKTGNARFIRVLHNGLLVQDNVEVDGPTRSGMEIPEAPANSLMLQGDHGPVAFRNLYVRPLRPVAGR